MRKPKKTMSARARWAAAVCCGVGIPRVAAASQYIFTGPTNGLWNTAANWTLNGGSTHVVPANGDDAFVGNNSNGATQVDFTGAYTGAGLNSLTLNSPQVPLIQLVQNTSGSAMVATSEYVGTTVSGNIYNQSAGTNTTYDLYLGYQPGGSGQYLLSGSGFLSTGSEDIGSSGGGGGYFIQSGGTNNVSGNVTVVGATYTLTSGTLNVLDEENTGLVVGGGVSGSFIQAGGTVNIISTGLSVGSIFLDGSGCSYVMTSGVLNLTNNSLLTVGDGLGANYYFNQSGGTVNLTNTQVDVGVAAGTAGTYFLSGSGQMLGSYSESIGMPEGTGTFIQSTGTTQNMSGGLTVAYGDGTGYYYLNGGTLIVGAETVAYGDGSIASGLFQQSGGTHTVNGTLSVGAYNGSGTYIAYAGLLTVNASLLVGVGGIGIDGLNDGYGKGLFSIAGPATINVSAGVLSLGNSPSGNEGSAVMQQSAGTVNTPELLVGNTSAGSYFLYPTSAYPASGVLNVNGEEIIGASAPGDFEQSAGTQTVTGDLYVGYGATGTLNLSGGTANISGGRDVLFLGYQNTSSGILNIASGANLTATGAAYVGYSGTGTWNQSGGNATVTDSLIIGRYLGSLGTLYLQGGTLTADTAYVGYNGVGQVFQSGGTFNVSSLAVGLYTVAHYTLTVGTLLLPSTGSYGEVYSGSVFNQSGGTVSGWLENYGQYQFSGGGFSSGTTLANMGGNAYFKTDAGAAGQNLTVNISGGSVAFESTQHLAGLNLSAGGFAQVTGGGNGHRSMLYTSSLTVTGTLDLTNNDLDLQGGGLTALTNLTAQVRSGYHSGSWTGTGIISSTAASDSRHLTALGVILNANTGNTALYTSFDGVPVAFNDVLVKYTYYGDTNLSGLVDGTDYSRIDASFLSEKTSGKSISGWYNGDFNYDGVIDGSDYTLMDNAFNTQAPIALADEIATTTSEIAGASAVPEPASLVTFIAVMGLLTRRKRQTVWLGRESDRSARSAHLKSRP